MCLVMCRSVLAGVVAQSKCFSDCNFCYVLSLGFVLACGYVENLLPDFFLQTPMPTCANCTCPQNL